MNTSKKKLVPTTQFRRDVKKQLSALLSEDWVTVTYCLINNLELPEKYKDHELKGNFKGIRECHIKPDALLMYKIKRETVELIRFGSHSELFD